MYVCMNMYVYMNVCMYGVWCMSDLNGRARSSLSGSAGRAETATAANIFVDCKYFAANNRIAIATTTLARATWHPPATASNLSPPPPH